MNSELAFVLIPSGLVVLVAAVWLLSRRRVQLRSGANWVPCYDFKSKSVAYIAREKLKHGMVQARIHGIEGQVWIDPAQMKAEKYQHPPLDDATRARLREFAERLREVHALSVEQWEERIRRDPRPEREVERWSAIAAAYARELEGREYNLPQKKDVLQVILACAGSDRATAVKTVRLEALARTTAEQIASRCADLLAATATPIGGQATVGG